MCPPWVWINVATTLLMNYLLSHPSLKLRFPTTPKPHKLTCGLKARNPEPYMTEAPRPKRTPHASAGTAADGGSRMLNPCRRPRRAFGSGLSVSHALGFRVYRFTVIVIPIVSIVVPFWGLPYRIPNTNRVKPKRELRWRLYR